MQNQKDLLRFTTVGSVDDGKSTLIGRLLFDSKSVFQDQLSAIEKSSLNKGFDYIDLSLLTDGLKSEREQGITIDVAYRYFETPKRKFIIADTPGHIQYTRNMVTGASTANLAIILIDARKGIQEQTNRHSFIASLLGIKHLIVCINKMDLIQYDEIIYEKIVKSFKIFSTKLTSNDIRFIPISALHGDNVVNKSEKMKWYDGTSLLNILENIHISSDRNLIDFRFPIQTVIRPHRKEFQDFRGYAGRVSSGVIRVGDRVKLLPSGFISKISKITMGDENLELAYKSMSVLINLEDDIDLSRGDMIVREENVPRVSQNLELILVWMEDSVLKENKKLILKHTTNELLCIVNEIKYEIDINTMKRNLNIDFLKLNSLGKIKLRLSKPIYGDLYSINRNTGSLIFIDPISNKTVGSGIITKFV